MINEINQMMHNFSHRRQQGTALVITLLILIVMTLFVLSGTRNTTLQLRMASNLQAQVEALQNVHAAVDDIIATYNSTDFDDNDACVATQNAPRSDSDLSIDAGKEDRKFGCTHFIKPDTTKTDGEGYLQLSSSYLNSSTIGGPIWVEVERVQEKIDLSGFTIKAGFKGAGGGNWVGTGYELTSGYDGRDSARGRTMVKVGAIKLSRN